MPRYLSGFPLRVTSRNNGMELSVLQRERATRGAVPVAEVLGLPGGADGHRIPGGGIDDEGARNPEEASPAEAVRQCGHGCVAGVPVPLR